MRTEKLIETGSWYLKGFFLFKISNEQPPVIFTGSLLPGDGGGGGE